MCVPVGRRFALLSVGLVVFSAFAVGWVTYLLLPTVGLAAAFAFAAVVAPTDASAVTATSGRLHLPHRVVTVLEGESLLNDATALVVLNTAIAAIVSSIGGWSIAGDLTLAVIGGTGVGLVVGWLMAATRSRLRSSVLDTSLALITPYLAFIAADAVHGSGVLAVVVSALYLGFRSPVVQSAEARVAEAVNWRTVSFLIENAVFLFIGLNAAGILRAATSERIGVWATVGICAVVIATLFVARFVFILVMVAVFKHGTDYMRTRDLRWKNAIIISAANVRGVVTLAAVFLLPPTTPGLHLLQLMAFVVVVVSLLIGLALPRLVAALKLDPDDSRREFADWQQLMAQARARGLHHLESTVTDQDNRRVIEQLQLDSSLIGDSLEHETDDETLLASYRRLRRSMIRAEREYVITERAEHGVSEAVVAAALRTIDIEELALRAAPVLEDAETSPRLARLELATEPARRRAKRRNRS